MKIWKIPLNRQNKLYFCNIFTTPLLNLCNYFRIYYRYYKIVTTSILSQKNATVNFFVSFYFYYENISQHNIQTLPNTKDDTTYTNKKITNKIATFINNLSIHHIKLEKVHYDKKKLHSTILATNQNLYNFLALYKKNHTIVKLEKVDETLFIAEIEIEF